MADVAKLIARIRSFGANVMLDGARLTIVNREKLPAGAMEHIKAHGRDIAAFLDQEAEFEEKAAIAEYDGGLSRAAAEALVRVAMASAPREADPADWAWHINEFAKVLDRDLRRAA